MALANVKPLRRQTRSTYCAAKIAGTKALCHRLAEHKGDCRPTLHEVAAPAPVKPQARKGTKRAPKARKASAPAIVLEQTVLGYLVTVFDDGTVTSTKVVEAHPVAPAVPAATKAGTRAISGGVEALSADRYTVLPDVLPEGRDVQAHKSAKRGRFVVSGKPSGRLA